MAISAYKFALFYFGHSLMSRTVFYEDGNVRHFVSPDMVELHYIRRENTITIKAWLTF